jgi:hypothetical protein
MKEVLSASHLASERCGVPTVVKSNAINATPGRAWSACAHIRQALRQSAESCKKS